MNFGNGFEFIALWIIVCMFACFMGAWKVIIPINVLIVICIIAGFFMGFGMRIFHYMF